MWFRHRFNHRASERNRTRFTRFGHYNTWLIDELQRLVLQNHGVLMFPDWSNTSEFKDTAERFGTIPIHTKDLGDALKAHMKDKLPFKLSCDMKYIAKMTNVPVPFLSVNHPEEKKLFTTLMASSKKFDSEQMALDWVKYVDKDKQIYPKLPVYLRSYWKVYEKGLSVKATAKSYEKSTNSLRKVLEDTQKEALPDQITIDVSDTGNTNTSSVPAPFPQVAQIPGTMNAVPTGEDIGSAGLIVVGNTTIGSPGVVTKTTKRVRSKDASPSPRLKTCVVCEFKKITPGCERGKQDRKKCPHYNKDDEDKINRAMKYKKNAAATAKKQKN